MLEKKPKKQRFFFTGEKSNKAKLPLVIYFLTIAKCGIFAISTIANFIRFIIY